MKGRTEFFCTSCWRLDMNLGGLRIHLTDFDGLSSIWVSARSIWSWPVQGVSKNGCFHVWTRCSKSAGPIAARRLPFDSSLDARKGCRDRFLLWAHFWVEPGKSTISETRVFEAFLTLAPRIFESALVSLRIRVQHPLEPRNRHPARRASVLLGSSAPTKTSDFYFHWICGLLFPVFRFLIELRDCVFRNQRRILSQ